MKPPKTPPAPKALSPATRRLWSRILADFQIDDAAHLKLLEVTLLALDRAEALRVEIDRTGPTTTDRFGQLKPNVLLPAERDARSQFMTGIKALGLSPMEIGS